MNRRTPLSSALPVGLSLLVGPAWPRNAFASRKGLYASESERMAWLQPALVASKSSGKPLLVLAAPTDAMEARQRGDAFGAGLNHGSDEMLAPLAEVEVVAAGASDLSHALGIVLEATPLFWLVEGGVVSDWNTEWDSPAEQPLRPNDVHQALTDGRITSIDRNLRSALSVRDARQRRAAFARQHLSKTEVAALRSFVVATGKRARPRLAMMDRGASILAALDGEIPRRVIAAMANAARRRVVNRRIPGALWGRATICGSDEFEGVEPEYDVLAIGCGVGSIPRRSERFLHFYTCQS